MGFKCKQALLQPFYLLSAGIEYSNLTHIEIVKKCFKPVKPSLIELFRP